MSLVEPSTQDARLKALKEQIAQRKLQRQQQQQIKTDSPVTPSDRSQEEKKQTPEKATPKKLKKRKIVKDDGDERNDEEEQDEKEIVETKTKRKSKKAGLSDADALLEELAEGVQGLVPSQKKGEKTRRNEWVKAGEAKTESVSVDETGDGEEGEDDEGKESGGSDDEEEKDVGDTIGGFSILGNFHNDHVKPAKRRLPGWLAKPSIIKGGAGRREQKDSDQTAEGSSAVLDILDSDIRLRLQENNIHNFFPVQQQFIPELWEDLRCGLLGGRYGLRPRDICVSAPTGSGKTLAYVLPIVQVLKQRTVPKIYAVIVLPVRDLAEQVYKVFCQYCAGTRLKVGLAVGKTTISVEQESLVKKRYPDVFHSMVDIIVATPGRLVDHIKSTPGFDLSWLRFLVIDEADRMMEDMVKNDWLSAVEEAAYTAPSDAYFSCPRLKPGPSAMLGMCKELPLQKLLFSATLSHNPEKLEQLKLFKPQLMTSVVSQSSSHPVVNAQPPEDQENADDLDGNADSFVGKYTTPEGLTEYLIESEVGDKPLLMLHFMHNLKFRNVLCFTNSVEATHRLCLLMKVYGGLKVQEFSSKLPPERRKKILRKFSNEKIDLLVCSDAMARGMDVDNVKYVISYDNPPYIKTYIHRVGRTARAGRAGTAISLLEKKEFFHFKKMMRDAGKWSKITEMKFGRTAMKPLEAPFKEALSKLPGIIKEEKKKSVK